ncbi:MFS transporter [Priestia koreensis]|uniref:MFS transporter n=1 Tax=Priestia koreensis TaxID=284581 RepID=UPI0028F6CEFE|nr:MFS transporter [Priestia koreensis]
MKETKLWTVPFTMIVLTTFIFFICVQMLTAGFPVYIAGVQHDTAKAGIMTTAFMIAAIITRPFMGALLHKMNMKRALLIVFAVMTVTLVLSYNQSALSILIPLRIIQGIGFGINTTILATMATNRIPGNRLGEGIGYFGMATSLGTTLGPMVALSLLHSFSFNIMIISSVILMALSFVFAITVKNLKLSYTPPKGTEKKPSLLQYAFDSRALLPVFLVMLFYFGFAGIINFIDGLGKEANLGSHVSLFFLINAVIMVVIRPFTGRIYDRFGHKYLVYPGALCGIIGLVLLSNTYSMPMFILAAILYGVAYGIMQPTFQAWAVSRVEVDKRPTANAMTLSFMDLGVALGSLVLGSIVSHTTFHMMYAYSSLLVVALLILYFFRKTTTQTQKYTVEQ